MTWQPDIETYHADDATGSTMLSVFRESPGLYHGRYITGEILPPAMGKPANLGSLIHAHLEGETIQPAPVLKRNAKAFKECRAEHGRLACTKPEAEIVLGATLALMNPGTPMAKLAKWLLIDCPGKREYSHRWKHPSGEVLKCRYDVLPDQGQGSPRVEHEFVDLKFVGECKFPAFQRISAQFGRHCQAALYSHGYQDLRGEWPVVTYVIIGNAPPFPIKVCTLSERFIEIGLDQIQADLAALAECRKSGKWFDAEELEAETVPELEPPHWLARQHEERMEL